MLLDCDVGEDSWESLGLQGDQTNLNIHWKDWCWSWNSNIWPPEAKNWLIGKDPDAGKDWRQEDKEMTEDEMFWWHHRFFGDEFEQTHVCWWTWKPCAAVHGVTKSWTQLSNWTDCTLVSSYIEWECQYLNYKTVGGLNETLWETQLKTLESNKH